jgi:hypothetical protein
MQRLIFQKFLVISLLGLLLSQISCTESKKETVSNQSNESASALPGEYNYENREYKEDNCSSNCTGIEVNYPVTDNYDFKNVFEKDIRSIISNYLRSTEGLKSLDDYAKGFLDNYKDFKSAFPESNTPWTLEVDMEIIYNSASLICYKTTVYSYTGGAHSNEDVQFKLLDKNANSLNFNEVIKNSSEFLKLAEDSFRKEKGIPLEKSWEESGYNFSDNQFDLPENIGISKKGVILYYNNYEIASYADGSSEILIPMNQVKDLLNEKYLN